MEYMREKADEKEEATTETSNRGIADTTELEVATIVTAWQEQKKLNVNWRKLSTMLTASFHGIFC